MISKNHKMKQEYNKGLVSVIIPTYNRSQVLVEAMDSVWKQTYRPIELIVVDDGSTDNTKTTVKSWTNQHQQYNFKILDFYQENKGAPAARNLGLANCSGEFIQFLDSDDMLLPTKFSDQVEVLEANPEETLSYCMCKCVDEKRGVEELIGLRPTKSRYYEIIANACNSITPLWRRSAVIESGPWDEELPCWQDWDFGVRARMKCGVGVFVPKVLCVQQIHPGKRITDHGDRRYNTGRATAFLKNVELFKGSFREDDLASDYISRKCLTIFKHCVLCGEYQSAVKLIKYGREWSTGSDWLKYVCLSTMMKVFGMNCLCGIVRRIDGRRNTRNATDVS